MKALKGSKTHDNLKAAFAGESPLATCHAISPLFMSYAVMRPYGGLIRRSPP